MKHRAVLENLSGAIVEICRSGLAPEALRERVLSRLRRAVPFDAAFWSTVDPATLLFTHPHQEQLAAETVPYFIENEFLDDDVNKWTVLARDRLGARTLFEATDGDLDASQRYRDIFRPLGLGDELRSVLRVGGQCWGVVCLHREAGAPFSEAEVRFVRRLAPHLAEAIRAGLLLASVEPEDLVDAPGLVVVAADGSLVSVTEAGARWLEELGHPQPDRGGLPIEVRALAAMVDGSNRAAVEPPRLRIRTGAGRWAVLHASRLPIAGAAAVAVIIEEPAAAELAPLLMLAYGLTERERTVTRLVCRGLSTHELTDRLQITPHTLQDHLKSIFDKTGVSSRRELVVALLQDSLRVRTGGGSPAAAGGPSTRGR